MRKEREAYAGGVFSRQRMMLLARMVEVWDGLTSVMRRDSMMALAFVGVEKWEVGVPV